ncbi:hypothetical protein [Candidatus Nitrotoga arctica]|uniref:Lipoprotein n=1 Tax=Candidatus Nitrotoga arctica TaxID=453162 RepID=A0ABM8YYV8_9PROT|nr:hypothetical protein [Candidatus Nitrotoga arctica]CAG9932716.1 conserved protein of unknown function [Candidatus Nitrotoga arctica]
MLTIANRGGKAGILLLMATLLSGCAGARFYSEARDNQGKAAHAAWQKVDLTKMVSTDRDNLNQVLQAQLDTQDKLAAAIRNNKLRALIEQEVGETNKKEHTGLLASIEASLNNLVKPDASNEKDASKIIAESREAIETYQSALTEKGVYDRIFSRNGLDVPSCDEVKDSKIPDAITEFEKTASTIQKTFITGALKEVRNECEDPISKKFDAAFSGFEGGAIATAVKQQKDDEKNLAEAKAKTENLRTKYKVALSAYNAAVTAAATPGAQDTAVTPAPTRAATSGDKVCPDGPKTGDDAVVKAGEAGKYLCRIVALIDEADDAFSISFISKERLDALDKFVTTVTKTNLDGKLPDDASEAAKAFVLLPKLMVDAKESIAAAKKPLMLPLMIRRNMEQLKLDGANKEITILETRVQLSKAIVDTLYAQAVQVWRAYETLTSDGSKEGYPDMRSVLPMKMVEAFSKASKDQKEVLYNSASMYSDALNRLSAKRYKLEYQRIATFQEVSLSYAEVNLKQWSTLIGGSVDQVAESASLGIKPETIAALLNTIGIFYIGHGVSK